MKRRNLTTGGGNGGGGRFKRLPDGKYQCPDCNAIFEGFAARQDAIHHSRDGLCPVRLPDTHSGPFLAHRPQSNSPGDGYARPDRSRHWRLGRNAEQKREIAYMRAFHRLEQKAKKEDAFFERLISSPRRGASLLQRFAQAYTQGFGWEAVKHAALEWAADELIRRGVRERIEKIFSTGALAEVEAEAFKDGDLTPYIVEADDVNIN